MSSGSFFQPLAVTRAGTRDYVQGTQMLARAAEVRDVADLAPLTLKRAGFRRITSHLVAASSSNVGHNNERPLGAATFETLDGSVTINYFELSEQAPRAPVGHMPSMTLAVESEAFSGAYEFSSVHGFEDLLNLVVQATKRVHESSQPAASDVWFTGLTDGELPFSQALIPASGQVSVEHVRTIAKPPQFQTLSNVTVLSANKASLSVVLSFSFRVE